MAFPKAEIHQKPIFSGEGGYTYGGSWIVLCPIVRSPSKGIREIDNSGNRIILELSENDGETAKMVADAINEKLEREFNHGSA
jgi:hypothetical protein